MKRLSLFLLVFIFNVPLMAQQAEQRGTATVYQIPFASEGNTIELTIENSSAYLVNHVKVIADKIPSWVHFTSTEQLVDLLKPSDETNVVFTFSIDKTAPVNKEQHLTFFINTPAGETWTKEITIVVSQPQKFALFQNYPNPFNPVTNIDFTVPVAQHVSLKIYDVLGREINTLVDEVKQPGGYTVRWDVSSHSSGLYFYRLRTSNFSDVKKLSVVK